MHPQIFQAGLVNTGQNCLGKQVSPQFGKIHPRQQREGFLVSYIYFVPRFPAEIEPQNGSFATLSVRHLQRTKLHEVAVYRCQIDWRTQ